MRIGPEPTTDKFVAVVHGPEDQLVPGNAVVMSPDQPFRTLQRFGNTFLNKFEASFCSSTALKSFTLIDSPGVLSGKKQTHGRHYDFAGVVSWFANRADRILLLFDAHKLDIGDEFKAVIASLKGHEEKVRVVLNKADQINPKELMRVYGALMWSLGKVAKTPEVLRVYIGSFWDKPLDPDHDCYKIFKGDAAGLIGELKALPRQAAMRKISEFVKRVRLVRIHAQIMSDLKREMPKFFGKSKKQQKIIEELHEKFRKTARSAGISEGDLPPLEEFKATLNSENISKYPTFTAKQRKKVDEALQTEIPKLVERLNEYNRAAYKEEQDTMIRAESYNPFDEDESASLLDRIHHTGNANSGKNAWVVSLVEKTEADNIFYAQVLTNGKLTGKAAKKAFSTTGLEADFLRKIWTLVDFDKSNALDADQFAVALHLAHLVKKGEELPAELPPQMIPPSRRD